jgi:hypothetical protein
MAGSIDDKDSSSDQAGKRPAPTIEGKATEVSVEPETAQAETAEPAAAHITDGGGEPRESGEDAATEAAEDTVHPDKAARSLAATLLGALTSFTTHAAAGLLGGLLVLLGVGLGYLPLGEPSEPAALAPLKDRVAKLEAEPSTPDNTVALKTMDTRLATLEDKAPDSPPELAALSERVADLESSLKSMAEAAKDGGSVAGAAAISQQIKAAETRLDAKIEETLAKTDTADGGAIAALKKEVADLEARLKALAEASLGQGEASQLVPEFA